MFRRDSLRAVPQSAVSGMAVHPTTTGIHNNVDEESENMAI
jgi:hypothetical protein